MIIDSIPNTLTKGTNRSKSKKEVRDDVRLERTAKMSAAKTSLLAN